MPLWDKNIYLLHEFGGHVRWQTMSAYAFRQCWDDNSSSAVNGKNYLCVVSAASILLLMVLAESSVICRVISLCRRLNFSTRRSAVECLPAKYANSFVLFTWISTVPCSSSAVFFNTKAQMVSVHNKHFLNDNPPPQSNHPFYHVHSITPPSL